MKQRKVRAAELSAQMAEDSRRAKVILAGEEWDASWPASPFMPGAPEAPQAP